MLLAEYGFMLLEASARTNRRSYQPDTASRRSCPHVGTGNASSDEPITFEHAVICGERVGKLRDRPINAFMLIVVDGVALRFLHRGGDGFVVAFGEAWLGAPLAWVRALRSTAINRGARLLRRLSPQSVNDIPRTILALLC